MTSTALTSLLAAQLGADRPLPDLVLRRALDASRRDAALRVALAGYRHLPVDARAALAADRTAAVRVAFLSRADLTDGERDQLLGAETRAGVLGPVVVNSTDGRLLDRLTALLEQRPTRTLAEALFDAAQASPATKVAAICVLDRYSAKLTQDRSGRVLSFIQALAHAAGGNGSRYPGLGLERTDSAVASLPVATARALLEHVAVQVGTAGWVGSLAHVPEMSAAARAALLRCTATAVPASRERYARYSHVRALVAHAVAAVGFPELHPQVAAVALGEGLEPLETAQLLLQLRAGGCDRLPRPVDGAEPVTPATRALAVCAFSTDIGALVRTVPVLEHAHAQLKGRAANANDPLPDGGLLDGATYGELAAVTALVAGNPALPVPETLRLVPLIVGELRRSVTVCRQDSDDVVTAVVASFPHLLVDAVGTLAPDTVVAAVAAAVAACGSSASGYPDARLRTLAGLQGLPREAYLALPWRVFYQTGAGAYWCGTDALVALAEAQADRLGDSVAAWDLFAALAEDFHGTAGELLDAATLAAAA